MFCTLMPFPIHIEQNSHSLPSRSGPCSPSPCSPGPPHSWLRAKNPHTPDLSLPITCSLQPRASLPFHVKHLLTSRPRRGLFLPPGCLTQLSEWPATKQPRLSPPRGLSWPPSQAAALPAWHVNRSPAPSGVTLCVCGTGAPCGESRLSRFPPCAHSLERAGTCQMCGDGATCAVVTAGSVAPCSGLGAPLAEVPTRHRGPFPPSQT